MNYDPSGIEFLSQYYEDLKFKIWTQESGGWDSKVAFAESFITIMHSYETIHRHISKTQREKFKKTQEIECHCAQAD